MSNDEAVIESEIQAKGLKAPRLTPDHIDKQIVSVDYHVFSGSTLTVCAMTLSNGFIVTGESAAASPENFDAEIGRKIAYDNARNKIWAFEGYLLREKIENGDDMLKAVYGFAGYLSTREEIITAGSSQDAAPMACAVKDYLERYS